MPSNSTFYDKVVPIMLLALTIIMVVVLLAAVAGVIGWIRF